MTSSFGNIIGTQRDQIPKPVIPNYAATEPNLEEAVNDQITKNQADLEKFGAMLEQPELKQWDIDNNCVDTVYNLELVE